MAEPKITMVFFGDSICNGQGCPSNKTFVSLLAEKFEEYADIYSMSVNGETTRQALLRLPYNINGIGIDVIVFQYGLNDCNRWDTESGCKRVSDESFWANMKEMADKARAFGIKQVALMTNHPVDKNTQDVLRYNGYIRQAAEHNGIMLIDIGDIMHGSKNHLTSDGVHLNIDGNKQYYDIISRRIPEFIRECLT